MLSRKMTENSRHSHDRQAGQNKVRRWHAGGQNTIGTDTSICAAHHAVCCQHAVHQREFWSSSGQQVGSASQKCQALRTHTTRRPRWGFALRVKIYSIQLTVSFNFPVHLSVFCWISFQENYVKKKTSPTYWSPRTREAARHWREKCSETTQTCTTSLSQW